MTVARASDLALPDFAAFNHGQTLPWMRRWEMPFALFHARLDNNHSVLDCTINPATFQERLLRLYPHTLYRHHNPVQGKRFVLPIGCPDAAFDRVICVNTLEHLLKPQRASLIAALARKLVPGGLLVLTSDSYFESSWTNPAFLRGGVMREDRREIFNGWNRVTMGEWLETCGANGLFPVGGEWEAPREGDEGLYLNQAPFIHATIAGVFSRGCPAQLPQGRRVVLGLLTWNTRDVSLASVQAYVREARMLQRLGQHPFLCVCDNGSVDGTAEALSELGAQLDVQHRFILNATNRGNSIARNQIIDYAREVAADYLLFMDGDIEIVPFSSFAMLRHLENSGRQLGCIGADSAGQTPHRSASSPYWYSVDPARTEATNLVAWTQYGMFRREMFDDGIRFDEHEPFDRAGWGFEDNDLAFQMEMKGYVNQRFFGMTYLHREARSSIRIMRQQGIDVMGQYLKRKDYVISKWATTGPINTDPLAYVRNVKVHL